MTRYQASGSNQTIQQDGSGLVVDHLRLENSRLLRLLRAEWEENHHEHCGEWPHPKGEKCYWPMPAPLRRA